MYKKLFSTTTQSLIYITNNAWDKLISVSKSHSFPGFLFLANSGGCNGFNYKLKLINHSEIHALVSDSKLPLSIFEKHNTQLIVDPLSEMLLLGTTIDYIKEDFSKNVYDSKFIFTPDKKIASGCGCGVSFNPK
tara:strand:- start:864 stop:1265 length:402 start_codon:yes stop_codon:yes gene_type:complete